MLIDFKELSKLLPEAGGLSLSVKKGEGEKLDILFRVKHDLVQMKNSSARSTEEGKQIEAATKLLDQPYAFSATAEELNASFEEKIKQPVESTRSLVEIITDRTKALDEAAKSIRTATSKTKSSEKSKVTGPADTTTKTLEKAVKNEPPIGNLFGSVGTETGKPESDNKPENKPESAASAPAGSLGQEQEIAYDDSELEDVEEDIEEEQEAA
ncbi:MAG: PRTRC system protein E [Thermodesulfovibrionales bacterium]